MLYRAPTKVLAYSAAILLAAMFQPDAQCQTEHLVSVASADSDALRISNPKHREIPAARARVLLLTTCKVVADEFHRKDTDVNVRMDLVIGEPSERYSIEKDGRLILYLDHWDETRFVDVVITGAMQQLTPPRLRRQMLTEVLKRSDQIAPVSTKQLHGPMLAPRNPGLGGDCMSAVNGEPCSWPGPMPPR